MPGMYDDYIGVGPFEKMIDVPGRGGKRRMIRRPMTMDELQATNQDLLDQIAVYAKKLEYCINKYNIPAEELAAIK